MFQPTVVRRVPVAFRRVASALCPVSSCCCRWTAEPCCAPWTPGKGVPFPVRLWARSRRRRPLPAPRRSTSS